MFASSSLIVFGCFLFLAGSQCANILGLFPLQIKSHYIIFDALMTELARRGHNVTVVNPFPKIKSITNFTDIDVSSCSEVVDATLDTVYDMFRTNIKQISFFTSSITTNAEAIAECEPVKNLKEKSGYDLIITELFYGDVMLGFARQFQVPFVSFCTGPILPWGAERTGNPDNPAYVPYVHNDIYFDRLRPTFYQRLYNTILYLTANSYYSYYSYFNEEPVAKKFFGPDLPSLNEIAKNTSLILSFAHFSVNPPRPLVPNVVEVAGLQIVDAQPLPKDIEKFMDESEHGVIYFCMGSLLKSETMPEHKRQAFLNAFAKLPQRVVWKWRDELQGKTDNIFIREWMPQRDILAHPKIKLFISHGGALGLNEAVFEGVPVLGIPMYGDQTNNLNVLKSYGAAEILHYSDINEDTVLPKILQVLQKQYKENMEKVSAIYKDRPMSPMDTAIYWIEYVIRHKGASHLRSAAVDLPIYQYLLLDVIACIVLVVLSSILFLTYLLKLCFTVFCKTSEKNKKNKII